MTLSVFQIWAGQTILSVAILTAFILLIRRPFARRFGAKAAYCLWSLPVLRVFMPPVELAWLNAPPPPSAASEAFTAQAILTAMPQTNLSSISSLWTSHGAGILTALWGIGAVIFITRQLYRQNLSVKIWLNHAQAASPSLQQTYVLMVKTLGLKTAPKITLSPDAPGPLVAGVIRPHIILPFDFETAFTPQEQRYALLHELSHVKRGDLYASLAALGLRAANWPNPLIHYAARYFRADQEAACDATVLNYPLENFVDHSANGNIANSRAYAQTLIKAALQAQKRIAPRNSAPALALTIHHPLKERLMTLSNPITMKKLRHRLAATAVMASTFALNAPISLVPAAASAQTSDGVSAKQETHIVRSRSENNGVIQDRKVEVNIIGDNVKAFEVDPVSGIKTEINPETIQGYEKITRSSGQFTIDQDNGQVIQFVETDGNKTDDVLAKLKSSGKISQDAEIGSIRTVVISNSLTDNDELDQETFKRFSTVIAKGNNSTILIDDATATDLAAQLGVNAEDIVLSDKFDIQFSPTEDGVSSEKAEQVMKIMETTMRESLAAGDDMATMEQKIEAAIEAAK